MKPFLSLVIPAYNEEARIGNSLKLAVAYMNQTMYKYEILIVDDGSKDNTIKVASEFENVKVIAQPRNMGKGAAVKAGMLAAEGDICIFSDADFSTPVYEVEKVIQAINLGADVCIGNRALDYDMIRKHQPFYREFMGKTFNKFVQLLVIPGISDTQCGFKGFTNLAAKQIFTESKIPGFGFDVEILYIANVLGHKISQVPVEWYNDERSTVDPVRDSLRMLKDLFIIKKLHANLKK